MKKQILFLISVIILVISCGKGEITKKDMIKGKTIEDKGAYIVGIIKKSGIEI